MTYRQIEASREIRLWISQVIVPVAVGVVMLDEDKRNAIKNQFEKMKDKSIEFINSFHS